MPIDTSSYYPEVPGQDDRDDSYSLNNREGDLFGNSSSSSPYVTIPKYVIPPETPLPLKPQPFWEKFVERFSEIMSWLLVPLMMPVYGIMLSFGLSILEVIPIGMRVVFTIIIFGIDVAVPMLLIYILKKFGMIDDVGLNGRKERLIPYIITIICYLISGWFVWFKGAPVWLSLFFVGGALAGGINLLVNFAWKISAHSAGIAGIVALLIMIVREGSPRPEIFGWIIASIVVAGLLGTARVWLGRHTVWQVLAGYAVGFLSVFAVMAIWG